MLKINFKFDKDIMARDMISRNRMPVDFATYLWEKYNSSYISLKKSIHANDIDPNIVKEVQKQGFFIKEVFFAQKNLKRVKKEWKHNQKDINEF